MFSRRHLIAAGAAAPWLIGAHTARSAPTPPTIDEFLRAPEVIDAALSPNGQRIAVLRESHKQGKQESYVLLVDANRLNAKPVGVTLGERKVQQVEWANDERLLIWVTNEVVESYTETGTMIPTDMPLIRTRRILALGADGRDQVILFDNKSMMLRTVFDLGRIVDFMHDDPQHVLMAAWDSRNGVLALHKVDVYTGDSTLLERGSRSTVAWYSHNGVPVMRYNANTRGTIWTLEARPPGGSDWKFVRKVRMDDMVRPDFEVISFTEDPNILLALAADSAATATVLRKFDLRTLQLGEVVAAQPGRDIEGAVLDEKNGFVGAVYTTHRRTYDFTDKSLNAHFKGVNKYFGDECNVSMLDVSATRNRFLMWVSGPRDARAIFLYDKDARHIEPLGFSTPWLSRDRLAPMEVMKVKTRDGAEIDAYLTVPLASGPRPLVVLPHGGPETRDSVSFDTYGQVFAAQGWMVLQPNFRGSGGYGHAFAAAGHRRWGDRMQEDVEDAVAQVLASGRIDPKRIAICGASYGGYAALMGAVRRPDLYRCAVSIAGVSDLPEMLEDERREEGADSLIYAYWVRNIGNPKADAALLEAASPARRVQEIQVPVLLIHGLADRTVRPSQSKIMARALKKAGKPYEHLELPRVGHRGWDDEAWKTVLERSVAFLGRSLNA